MRKNQETPPVPVNAWNPTTPASRPAESMIDSDRVRLTTRRRSTEQIAIAYAAWLLRSCVRVSMPAAIASGTRSTTLVSGLFSGVVAR